MRKIAKWLVAAAVLTLAIVVLRFVMQPKPIEVEVAVVAPGVVEDLVTNSEGGTVKSRSLARLGAERAGRVAAIPYREGAQVPRGVVLVALDPSTAATRVEATRRDLEAMDAAVAAARATEVLARQTLNRSEPLAEKGMISGGEMDEVRARLDAATAETRVAEARRAGARSAVRLAEDDLAHHLVRAPFEAVVTRRFVEVGESVIPGQAVLEVVSLDRLYVSAPIDERDAGRLEPGLPTRVTLDAYPDVQWSGEVKRVAPMIETAREQNRTLEIEVDLPRDTSRPPPRPGMTADVEIVLDRREGVLRIPSLAVAEGRSVLVVESGRAVSRPIEVGLRNWQWNEIRAGLTAGEQVITSLDRLGLKAGVAVRVRVAEPAVEAVPDTGARARLP